MPLLIAIGNWIGINELGITPPYGGEDIVTELGVQMVSEATSEDLITEQAPVSYTHLTLPTTPYV